MNSILEEFDREKESMISDLKRIVEMETPSTDKQKLDEFVNYFVDYIRREFSIEPEILVSKDHGNDIKIVFNGKLNDQVLLLCHYDTVFDTGSIAKNPFRIDHGRIYGPGIFDMKTGIVQAIYALKHLVKEGNLKHRTVLLITSDEEIDSDFSREIIVNEAKKSSYALVMEPSLNGNLKTGRSGVGTITVTIHGRAAHAGLEPEKGINAIYVMADLIRTIRSMDNRSNGISLNLDVISGGSRPNVIADRCEGVIDFRFRTPDQSDMVIRTIKNAKLSNPEAKMDIDYRLRPPMVRNERTAELFGKIKDLGSKLGLELGESYVYGGSDGNYCSEYCPVIDGLGAVGDGAHTYGEYVIADKIPERSALLYLILKTI